MTTRLEAVTAAAFAITAELDGSWGLATSRIARSHMNYHDLVLIGPASETLVVRDIWGNRRPWSMQIIPVLPVDEDEYTTGWDGQSLGLDPPPLFARGWYMPDEQRPPSVRIPVKASAREAAEIIERKILRAYRPVAARINDRNARRRERLADELVVATDMARHFGGPVHVIPEFYGATRCNLADGRSEVYLYTGSPRVEMRFILHRDHATAIAPELARLLGFVPATEHHPEASDRAAPRQTVPTTR